MTLQQIRYILAIAESRSVSTAAKRLFISQPSLSAALKDLLKNKWVNHFFCVARDPNPCLQ